MARSAFSLGEIELRSLLRIQDSARMAEGELRGLRIHRQRMIAMLNHALGVLP